MPIFTVEVRQGEVTVGRFIAAPFMREGNSLVNTEKQTCSLVSRTLPMLRFFEPVTELYLGSVPVDVPGDVVMPGDSLLFRPGEIRLSFSLGP